MGKKKVCKLWNVGRDVKKSIVASSLSELRTKGCDKLKYSGIVTAVLEEDGTIVEDEDYFELLEDNTTFIILKAGENWTNISDDASEDQVDFDGAGDSGPNTSRILQLVKKLRRDFSNLVMFSKEDLQLIVDTPQNTLSEALGNKTVEEAAEIIDSCQRYLDEQLEADEAIALVKVLSNKRREEPSGEDFMAAGAKRPRLENT